MKKNARTVSISLSVAMIFVTVFAVVSFTYSWYHRENAAQISSINMSSSGSSGILLSGNATDWKSVLSTTLTPPDVYIDENLSIDSISTGGTVIDGELQFYVGQFGENEFETTLYTEGALYHTFDFYVLNNDETDKEFTLAYNSSVVDTNNRDFALSTRIGFINLGSSAIVSEVIALDGTGISTLDYIWEPNSTIRNSRISLYHASYIPEGKTSYKGINLAASGLTLTNSLVVDNIETPEEEVVDVITNDPIGSGDNSEITILTQLSITKIRVYIWCEGQDIDCTNSVSGGTASVNLGFNTYDVQEIDEEYVAIEKFNTPTITNDSGANYIWNVSSTNLSPTTYASDYIFKISKYISGTLTPIRTVITSLAELDIDDLEDLELGQYYVETKAFSIGYCNSEYSNMLNFYVLTQPLGASIINSVLSWSAVEHAESYTIRVFDIQTETYYTANTTSLSLDLSTTLFNGSIYLDSGKQYKVSIKANGVLGYANSEYITDLNWIY